MSHVTGTVQTVSPAITIGPDSGAAPSSPNTWALNFASTPAPTGTKLLILHFMNASLPANNRLEVDLGYGTDTFTSTDGPDFWTRPVNIYALAGGLVPIRYITDGAGSGSVQLDKYGRGERQPGEQDPTALSNCDPFLKDATYTEPKYDPFWFCNKPPNWENVACVTPAGDTRQIVARSVGMIMHVDYDMAIGYHLSTCTVTLIGPDLVITAGHCMANPIEDAKSSSVTFDYQVDCSGARPAGYNARFYKVKKVLRQRWDSGGDYCLLQLEVPSGGLGIPPITMRTDIPLPGEQVFGMHHPNGAVKKLSIPHPGYDTVASTGSNFIRTNLDVSGGSSGSGLFDTSGRITGVLSSGFACNLGYFATAAILQDIANPVTPPATRDVMVVIDRSGSMSMDAGTGRTKIEEARDAASLFVQLVRAGTGNRVGLVSFSTTASSPVDFTIAAVNTANKTALIGPAPYSGGVVGSLTPGGSTTIGGGLEAARLQFPTPGSSPRTILLLTDGLQNTPPMISAVEGALAGIDIDAIGFGTEASLDGALLTQLTEAHNGIYQRAGSGLALKKFFALAFGNIFEAGALMDPEYELPRDQRTAEPIPFLVCGEESVTVVVGWDREDAELLVQLTTPGGATVGSGSTGVEASSGQTWTFLRVPLPFGGERDGEWSVEVFRPGGGEFPPPAPALHYFVNVLASGGPRLVRMPDGARYYTGDEINPLVLLRDSAGGFPENAKVQVTILRPDTSVGNLLTQARMREPVTLDADTIPARQATLQALEEESGKPAVSYSSLTFDLFDDPAHTNGTFERGAIFGSPLKDLLTAEGNYTFHFHATYGETCTATRELVWSLHVDVGVDPSRTDMSTTVTGTRADGKREAIITVIPRDRYGNHLGPGRSDGFSVAGGAGTTVTAPVHDNGDGSYSVPVTWDPGSGQSPGVVIGQPGRPPVVTQEPPAAKGDCRRWKYLAWLFLLLAVILLIMLVLLLLM
jgi:V8-like Glu-specific endopeptidase